MSRIKNLDLILDKLASAKKVAMLTGAGVSAESGIKTFRDPDGLWAKFNPAELASADGFMSNQQLVWDWYQERRSIISECKPNAGHYAIAEMETMFEDFALITQNVDRLHQTAGSKNIYELHGNIVDNHCFDCDEPYLDDINPHDNKMPPCKKCGGRIRPSVVWFGEMLPEYDLTQGINAAEECDVFFSVGTSAEVYPASNLPIIAADSGAFVIEINPTATVISPRMHKVIRMTSAQALPIIVEELRKRTGK